MQTETTEATLDDDGAPERERESKIGGERKSESEAIRKKGERRMESGER